MQALVASKLCCVCEMRRSSPERCRITRGAQGDRFILNRGRLLFGLDLRELMCVICRCPHPSERFIHLHYKEMVNNLVTFLNTRSIFVSIVKLRATSPADTVQCICDRFYQDHEGLAAHTTHEIESILLL